VRTPRLLLLLTAALLAAPTAAYAGTTVGTTPTPTNGSCVAPGDVFQVYRPGAPSTAIQSPGVITSWSFQAGAQPASVALRVFRPAAQSNQFTIVADAGSQDVAPGSGLRSFPTRIPVQSGDFIGLRTSTDGDGACVKPSSSDYGFRATTTVGSAPVGGTLEFGLGSGTEVDVSAVVEPDRDQDGYGDETQDQCPVYGATPCPTPDTVITQKPKRQAAVSKLAFTATAPASGFVCRLDKSTKGCTSPVRYRCLAPGKHRFSVYAIGTHGDPDTTPATTRFTVSGKRKGCGKRPVAARNGGAPVTTPDAVSEFAGGYATAKVLANDVDPEGDRLTVCGVSPAYQAHVQLDTEDPKKIGVFVGGRTPPGSYVFTYLACDGTSQTPGTLTVDVPAPPHITVKAVPGRPGKVRARSDADFRIRLTYGSNGDDQDGLVFIPPHGSVTFGTRYDNLQWTARTKDGTRLARGELRHLS
jgi:hypothetical protein